MWYLLFIPPLLFAVIAGAAYLAYRKAFYSSPKNRAEPLEPPDGEQYRPNAARMHTLIEMMGNVPYERVEITARDGTRLVGHYIHIADGAPLQIQFHGYRGGPTRDFCGGNKLAREMGQNTLLIYQRAHGESSGNVITFGIKERYDCLDWITYAIHRFGEDTEILLAGVSMGASTVLMAAGLSDLPPQVKGVLADSPYSAPYDIIGLVCRQMGIPPRLGMPLISLGALLYGHFHLREASPVEAVRHVRIPILLVHGEDDRFVPCDMSREILVSAAEAGCDIRLLTVKNAGHGISFMIDPQTYRRETMAFVERCLSERKAQI